MKMRNKILSPFALMFFMPILLGGCGAALTPNPSAPEPGKLRQQAVNIMRTALASDDPLIRCQAIETVAATETLALMPQIHKLLKNDYVLVRFAAALAIGDMRYPPARRSLMMLREKGDERSRLAAAYALLRLGYDNNWPQITQALQSSDQSLRANAVMVLSKLEGERALNMLYWAKDADDSDITVRLQAAEGIAKLGDKRIYSKLWTLLISKYIENKIIGICAMADLGTEDSKDAIITMLGDDVPEIRLTAAGQLGKLGYDLGEPEVLTVLRERSYAGAEEPAQIRIKTLAAMAIGYIGTDALKAYLPELLSDNNPSVRLAAANAVFQCVDKTGFSD